MAEEKGAFTSYVQSNVLTKASSPFLANNDRAAMDVALASGGARLKKFLRTTPISSSDPARRGFWIRLLATRYHSDSLLSTQAEELQLSTSHLSIHLSDQQLMPQYALSDSGKKAVHRVLHAVGQDQPSLVYSPLLYPLVALFLHYMSEKEAKRCAEVLLAQDNMLPQVVDAWRKQCLALGVLGKNFATKAYRFRSQQVDEKAQHDLARWAILMWNLPLDYVVRIVDCFLFEGPKVLYRAGLLIWKLAYSRYLVDSSTRPVVNLLDPLLTTISEIERGGYTPQNFMDRMFRIRNFSSSQLRSVLNSLSHTDELVNGTLSVQPASDGKSYVAFSDRDTNPSAILSRDELKMILEQLEEKICQLKKPVLLFSTDVDGTSLNTLFKKVDEWEETLLIVQTSGDLFGAYCSDSWHCRVKSENRFFGRGTSFVFTLRPQQIFYRWVNDSSDRLKNLFQKASMDHLQVGGGTNGAAIHLDANLDRGATHPSTTFDSPSLATCEDFRVGAVEVFGFEDVPIV